MTLPNDFIRLKFRSGNTVDLGMGLNGMEWPPPDTFELLGSHWRLLRRSQLSDEEAGQMPVIARGAEYEEADDAVLGSD